MRIPPVVETAFGPGSVIVHQRRALLVLVPWLLATGCEGSQTLFVDPPIDLSNEPPYTPSGPPQVEVGFYQDQVYRPLMQNMPLSVVNGSQGGTWTMPAIRVRGLDREITVTATVTTAAAELVGRVALEQRFSLSPDGWLEIQILPIPIRHAPPRSADAILDLYGMVAVFAVEVRDRAGRATTLQLNVTLAQG